MKLKSIAKIKTGYYSKSRGTGDVVYLQSKHFDDKGKLIEQLFPELEMANVPNNQLLIGGDILFAAKGEKNFATIYEHSNPLAVASTTFIIIRIESQSILPNYLCWLLNTEKIQKLLTSKAKGSSIKSISKSALEDLEVRIPNLKKQSLICELAMLKEKEKTILDQLQKLKKLQTENLIFKAINY